ncbi:MAG: aminotransferase class V-fold PLP-dependent enzyme, partial [Acidobacteria bacterium]|nr:aminotransferase class V-fold PLP-dependent enzyme [Acidobacteriota bacterium]
CTAHKLYGPKGIGALYVRSENPPVSLSPLFDGGGQERGLRSGTLNVPGIVGFGKACQIAGEKMATESECLRQLRDILKEGIFSELEEVHLNGHPTNRLPHNLNVSFGYVEGEALLMSLSDIAVSSGSACRSACIEPSHVLTAIGVPEELAQSTIRFGLGRFNTEKEVQYVKERVIEAVRCLRELSPHSEAGRSRDQDKQG